MLSRTADHLLWMSRYIERAENTARMLDVNYQTMLLPQSASQAEQGWSGLLSICELLPAYQRRHGRIQPDKVIDFMVADLDNPASIMSCLHASRENARAVRGTLTTEVWETYNQIWLEAQKLLETDVLRTDPSRFLEWVKHHSHLSRGVILGTMLHDQALHFMRLGTFLERADNTARLLDVKFHGSEHTPAMDLDDDEELDFYYWSHILRSVSAFEIYRKVYRDVITPERVAELLIMRPDMPRSLAYCLNQVVGNLESIGAGMHSGSLSRRLAGRLQTDLHYGDIREILHTGLHAYLTHFLERIHALGVAVSREFLNPDL
ncbi:alpha-E domain-containing protein [Brachymonas sp. G13]|uniref:alpha-E domain-containing protein n=1 Tax=Brachymonas wangyanguii TaxID=3130163 RepID=UPI00307F63A3